MASGIFIDKVTKDKVYYTVIWDDERVSKQQIDDKRLFKMMYPQFKLTNKDFQRHSGWEEKVRKTYEY